MLTLGLTFGFDRSITSYIYFLKSQKFLLYRQILKYIFINKNIFR